MRRVDGGEVGKRAVGGFEDACVGEFELFDGVGGPGGGEGLEGEDVGGAGAEERPHRHLDGAGVGARDDPEPPVGGHAEDGFRAIDHLEQARLGSGRTVRAAE